ncbi:MAG: class II aldolase/adducin family protein [Eubacteriales bacterium]|nr:class II aldolase/adducin family protein [Eubacteriales bacterium]
MGKTYLGNVFYEQLGPLPGHQRQPEHLQPELGLMAIKPSGIGYMETTPEDIVVMDLESHIVDGKRKPSSEWDMHTEFYKNKPSCRAIVHTHSRFCTTFAVLGKPIEAVHYVLADAKCYEVPCAPYRRFGTPELAIEAVKACGDGDAVLLANHGIIVCGKNLKSAFSLAETLEYVAELQYLSMCIGKPNVLSREQMDEVLEAFKSYGQPGIKRTGC